jgi:uncharacterized membrane protein YdbT with pleckstrin-like domain
MRYADTLMTTGETIVVRERQHWLALLLESRTALALFLLAAVTWLLGVMLDTTAPALTDILGWVALASLLLGLLILFFRAWQWWAQDYLITNRRILKVEGIINKRSADSSLEKINDAVLEQNVFARLFGYGDLDILTAADTAIDRYRMLNHAPAFKREMLNQKHNLEMEFSYRQPPSPPLRAASAPSGAAEAEASSPVRPTPREHASEEVTRTLSRLADLRDRGAITPEEYEAKKQELLGRL